MKKSEMVDVIEKVLWIYEDTPESDEWDRYSLAAKILLEIEAAGMIPPCNADSIFKPHQWEDEHE